MEEELERCRLCLAEDILKPDIFQSKDDDGVAAFTKIMLCTSLAVTPEDSYSKFICQQCSNMVELFFNFRNNCFKTHIMMYNTLQVMSQDDPGFVFELSGNGVKVLSEREKYVKEEPTEEIIAEDDVEDITTEDTFKNSTSVDTYQRQQLQVEEHVTDKEEVRRLKCLICRRVFDGNSELDAHWPECKAQVETQVHQTKGKEFTCQECGQAFKQLLLLRRHVQVKHVKTRPFACRLCPRRFYDQYELKYHGRLHEDTEDFVCTICGRRFSRKSGLKAHLRSHTGERPYKCAHCPRSFSHLTSLSSHLRVHTGERPYQCRYCEKKFAQYSTAKSHEEMHKGGERMHQCAVCHRMYRTEEELLIHEKLHPKNNSASLCCSLCPRTYTLRASLKRHLIKSHPQQLAKVEIGAGS